MGKTAAVALALFNHMSTSYDGHQNKVGLLRLLGKVTRCEVTLSLTKYKFMGDPQLSICIQKQQQQGALICPKLRSAS